MNHKFLQHNSYSLNFRLFFLVFSISYYFSSYKLSRASGKSPSINLLNDTILLKLFFTKKQITIE